MKAVFGGLLLAALLAAAEAKADPGPDPAPARSSASTATSRFRPAQLWGGIGFYSTSVSACIGASDLSWLAFGNIALAFGSFTSFPITAGGGIRGEHIGPVQLSGLAGLSIVPISGGGGTKVGLALGAQGNYPIPHVMPHLGIQGAFMFHILNDSVTVWTINAGVSYTLPY